MRTPERSTTNPRGYVLFIVMVIGVAASLAALSLSTTRGGAQVAAMHSERADASALLAEAGMQRALFYTTDTITNWGDFDAALDTDLDAPCGTSGTNHIRAATEACGGGEVSQNFRPDTSTDADALQEWTDGRCETINGRNYTCVSMNGGRYCVRFEDDDDDGVETDDWDSYTSNYLDTAGSCSCSGNCCWEGNAASSTACSTAGGGHDNGGARNDLRDRNRAIWIVSVGIFPDVDFDDAKHVTTLRRYYMAPRFPTTAGIRIKGDLEVSGSGSFAACSDIAGVLVDGDVEASGSGDICFSGRTAANSFTESGSGNVDHCQDTPAQCSGLAGGVMSSSITIAPADGPPLNTPAPAVPDMPHPWTNANEFIDFERPCVFWMDMGQSGVAARATGATQDNVLWVWDSEAMRGPWSGTNGVNNGTQCGNYEETAASDAAFPGPPDPAYSPGGGSACNDATDPNCYKGCWTPILFADDNDLTDLDYSLMATSGPITDIQSTVGIPNPASSTASAYAWSDFKCFHPWWRRSDNGLDNGSSGSPSVGPWGTSVSSAPDDCTSCGDPDSAYEVNDIIFERVETTSTPKGCDWYPTGVEGWYQTCDPSAPGDCYFFGNDSLATPAPLTSGTVQDPVNERLASIGMNQFPALTWLRKPDWREECWVDWPPPFSGLSAPSGVPYESSNNVSAAPSGSDSPYVFGNNRAMFSVRGGSNGAPHLWIKPQTDAERRAIPAGVYVFSDAFNVTGSSTGWGSLTAPDKPLDDGLNDFPLMTVVTFDTSGMQFNGGNYLFGVGQSDPGDGNRNYNSDWSKYASWINAGTVTFDGSPSSAYAGSMYSWGPTGFSWNGSGDIYVFGMLFSNGIFEIGGSGSFTWLYEVQMTEEVKGGFAGVNPTQSWMAQ